jgi:hypothetical protein
MGSKYSQELAALAKRAEPDRKAALAKLEALKKRSEGKDPGEDPVSGHSETHRIPAASVEMENIAHKRIPLSSGVVCLGNLKRSHGIESSKKMLAEI